jgi:hypothetical protein
MSDEKPTGRQKPMEATTTRNKKAPVKLSRDIQARLGQQLRSMYDDVVEQGVPDRFTDLLNRLDENGKKGKP